MSSKIRAKFEIEPLLLPVIYARLFSIICFNIPSLQKTKGQLSWTHDTIPVHIKKKANQ